MPKNPQWWVTLDAYHRFVIDRLEDAFGASRSDVIERMVIAWVSDHPEQVTQAAASIQDWRKACKKRPKTQN